MHVQTSEYQLLATFYKILFVTAYPNEFKTELQEVPAAI